MTSRFLIYGLTDPRNGEVRYVGRSTSGLDRPARHARASELRTDHSHKGNWVRKLLSLGLAYGVTVLEELPSTDGLNDAECRWIAHGRAEGWRLTNGTAGGDGMLNPPADVRAKLSAAHRGNTYRLGTTHSEATRRKMSESHRNASPEVRERTLEAQRRRRGTRRPPFTAEWLRNLALARGGRPFVDPAGKVHVSLNSAAREWGVNRQTIANILRGRVRVPRTGLVFTYAAEAA